MCIWVLNAHASFIRFRLSANEQQQIHLGDGGGGEDLSEVMVMLFEDILPALEKDKFPYHLKTEQLHLLKRAFRGKIFRMFCKRDTEDRILFGTHF